MAMLFGVALILTSVTGCAKPVSPSSNQILPAPKQERPSPIDLFKSSHPVASTLQTSEVDLNQDGKSELTIGYTDPKDNLYHLFLVDQSGAVLWEPKYPSVAKPEISTLTQGSELHLAVIQQGIPNLVYLVGLEHGQAKQLWKGEADERIHVEGQVVVLEKRTYNAEGGYSVKAYRLGWDQTKRTYNYLK